MIADWKAEALIRKDKKPVSPRWFLYRTAEILPENAYILAEVSTHSGLVQRYMAKPGGFFKALSGGLGMSMGGAAGVKLALPERLERVRQILQKLDVPVTLPQNLAEKDLIDLIKHDKKAVNKWPRFVLLNDIGKVYCPDGQYAVDVAPEILGRVLKKL